MARQEARLRLLDPARLSAQNVPTGRYSSSSQKQGKEGAKCSSAQQTPKVLSAIPECLSPLTDPEDQYFPGGFPLRDKPRPIQLKTADD